MVVTSNTAGVTVPNGTTIASLSGNTATLSNNVSGSGTPTFSAIGPSDTAADGGGIVLKGSPSDHTLTWSNVNDAWQSSEDMELANGKTYNIIDGSGNARQMLSLTQIGPTAGTGVVSGLGTGVTSSVLTSVGTLTSLEVSGNLTLSGTGYLQLPSGTDAERPDPASEGMLRWNDTSNVFEGYDGNVWGKIGGGAAVQSAAPTDANDGDLWYDTDDGRMFVYYTDTSSSQWVDASPNSLPTDLTIDGTITLGAVAGDNINVPAGLPVLFQTTAGIIQGGSGLTYNPGGDTLWVNGLAISQGGINGHTNALNLSCANHSSTCMLTVGSVITTKSNVEPLADNTDNLGSATKRWANVYTADAHFNNVGTGGNEVDGTEGHWTMQEGADSMYLINRLTGKKYKFNLTEVN